MIFPALCKSPLVPSGFKGFGIGVFPSTTPATMCCFGVWDVGEPSTVAGRVLFSVPMLGNTKKYPAMNNLRPTGLITYSGVISAE